MPRSNRDQRHPPDSPPRIIGGDLRGSKLIFGGQRTLRPMKDRVREAVFSRLGPSVKGKHAFDLFAGTGALGFEALSRGATRATFIERHLATLKDLRQNVAKLHTEEKAEIIPGDTFLYLRDPPDVGSTVWLVFCSPPYDFYVDRRDEMIELVTRLIGWAPPDSLFVVESDHRFDFRNLPQAESWDVRKYPPAQIGILRKADAEGDEMPA